MAPTSTRVTWHHSLQLQWSPALSPPQRRSHHQTRDRDRPEHPRPRIRPSRQDGTEDSRPRPLAAYTLSARPAYHVAGAASGRRTRLGHGPSYRLGDGPAAAAPGRACLRDARSGQGLPVVTENSLRANDEAAAAMQLRGPGMNFESVTCRFTEPDSAIAEWDMYFEAPSAEVPRRNSSLDGPGRSGSLPP